MKKALIVGHTGQDGSYLIDYLGSLNYEIIGISSRLSYSNFKPVSPTIDITNKSEVEGLIRFFKPDEVYYLAAVHQSSIDLIADDHQLFHQSMQINVLALSNFLEAISKYSINSRLFYAASSHVFGNSSPAIQDENTPFTPNCIYGITKMSGIQLCRYYHSKHNVFVSVGIFYNHESPLRASQFVSKKIVKAAVAIKLKKTDKLVLGNLNARIDWGYAPDFVEAAHQILQLIDSDTFVVCTGETHSVREFAEGVFSYLNLDWKQYVEENPKLITKTNRKDLQGNYSKLHQATGWEPKVYFNRLIEIMVDNELISYDEKQ